MILILPSIPFLSFQSRPFLKDRKKHVQLADPLLQGRFPHSSVHRVVSVIARCLQEVPSNRPRSTDIVVALEYLESEADSSEAARKDESHV